MTVRVPWGNLGGMSFRRVRALSLVACLPPLAFVSLGAATLSALHVPSDGRIVTVREDERVFDLKSGDTLRIVMDRNQGNVKARCDYYGGTLVRIDGQLTCDGASF